MPEAEIEVIRLEAAGCYGRNCADDVAADAALLSRAVGRPVRVQLTREQEHAWEPKGAAQLMDVNGGLDADGGVAGYDFATRYPSNGAPTLALLLTGTIPHGAGRFEMGDRTAIPPYDYDNLRVVATTCRRSCAPRGFAASRRCRTRSRMSPTSTNCATAAGVDPVEYRLRYLKDPRAVELVNAVRRTRRLAPRTGAAGTGGRRRHPARARLRLRALCAQQVAGLRRRLVGLGGRCRGQQGDRRGHVTRVVVGQDAGMMVNPAGVRHQIHGNVIQSTSRALKEEVSFDRTSVAAREWGGYPILNFPDVPVIDVLMMPRQGEPPLGAGESSSVPSAAAIANAIFDATGVRFRELPFTPERILRGCAARPLAAPAALPAPAPQPQPDSTDGEIRSPDGAACSRPPQRCAPP